MRSPSFLAPAALVGILCLSMVGDGAVGQTAPDSAWMEEPRILTYSRTADGFQVVSARDSDLGRDRITVAFDVEQARLTMDFVSFDSGNTTALGLDIQFQDVIEFLDADRDGRYGLGDTEVSRFSLAGATGTTLHDVGLSTDLKDVQVDYPLNVTRPGQLGLQGRTVSGLLTLRVRVPAAPTNLDGVPLSATGLRVDFTVRDFPFNRTDTLLATTERLAGTPGLGVNGSQVEATAARYITSFDWSPTGASTPKANIVQAGTYSGAGAGTVLTLAFPQSTVVRQGSVLEVQRAGVPAAIPTLLPAFLGDWETYMLGAAIAGLIVGGSAFVQLRRAP